MKFLFHLLFLFIATSGCANSTNEETKNMAQPKITIKTSEGVIKVALNETKAPETVKNFLSYVDKKHYHNTVFHRVISNFMIQGGGYSATFEEKKCEAPIKNEAANGLSNKKGTIAMARTSDVHSA